MMRMEVEWIDGATNACAQERATLCRLALWVGDENACVFHDPASGETFEQVTVPAVHLAEGIATDWWSLFGGRGRWRSLRAYRSGFVLPGLRLAFDGAAFLIVGERRHGDGEEPRLREVGAVALSREAAESALSAFVERVVERLAAEGVEGSEVALRWARVSESRADPHTRAFCEAAGALDADPYAIGEAEAALIEGAADLLRGEALMEYLAGLGRWARSVSRGAGARDAARARALESLRRVDRRAAQRARLPALRDVGDGLGEVARRRAGECATAPGYRAARAFRAALGVAPEAALAPVRALAATLGGRKFAPVRDLYGVQAVVCRDGEVRIHLRERGRGQGARKAQTFAFARAIGDAVCYPATGRSVVNHLHEAGRQAAGRAFAAELLAPVEKVLDMVDAGRDVDEIANAFNVSSRVVAGQIDDRDRIRRACATHA